MSIKNSATAWPYFRRERGNSPFWSSQKEVLIAKAAIYQIRAMYGAIKAKDLSKVASKVSKPS